MNRGTQYLRGKEGMLKVMKEERGKPPKEIMQYLDEKTGVMVHVLEGVKDVQYRTIPFGWLE